MTVVLAGLGTAVPDYTVTQNAALSLAKRGMGDKLNAFRNIEETFHNTGIEKRHSAAEESWFETHKDWEQRNQLYLEVGSSLFEQAATAALKDAGWKAQDIDAIVTVSSTGIATPTFEARSFTRIGFREDVMRVPVFGLGCAGGVSGLSIARDIASAGQRRVLMVAVETCTLQFRADGFRKADVVATALFGDGAAAACLSGATDDLETSLGSFGFGVQHIWPDTLPIMGWNMRNDGFEVVFDRSIPPFVEEHFSSVVLQTTAKLGKTLQDYERLVCHPGGTKVLLAIESCLDLDEGTLDVERSVLKSYGNMSAPTVLFVLHGVLQAGRSGSMLMAALGPGFTASFMPIEVH